MPQMSRQEWCISPYTNLYEPYTSIHQHTSPYTTLQFTPYHSWCAAGTKLWPYHTMALQITVYTILYHSWYRSTYTYQPYFTTFWLYRSPYTIFFWWQITSAGTDHHIQVCLRSPYKGGGTDHHTRVVLAQITRRSQYALRRPLPKVGTSTMCGRQT